MSGYTSTMKTRKCLRCGRQLYSYESQERGYGPKCRTKINKAIAQIKAKPEALDKVRQLILDQAITPFKGRINVYLAASSKDGNKYLSAPQTCTCPAGRFRPHQGSCYHQLAAEALHKTFGG